MYRGRYSLMNTLRSIALTAGCFLLAASAHAQTPSTSSTQPSTTSSDAVRPATTTFFGDTGLWVVPTAEVLPAGAWSWSGYRRGTNWVQGYSNVADFAGTFGYGIRGRAEIFGAFLFDTRIDRDVRPVFFTDANPAVYGGVIDRYPLVNQYWTGDNIGDFYIGGKFNLLSEADGKPSAFALRAMLKLPTGDTDHGVSTGKTDFSIDAIVSKEASRLVDVSG